MKRTASKRRKPALKKGLPLISVIIPALNEERSLPLVARDLFRTANEHQFELEIIVGDNGSRDRTAEVASEAGCIVISEPERGYGAACLKALTRVSPDSRCILFIDGDYSDFPEEFPSLVRPILEGSADLVIGSRVLAGAVRERGSLTLQQRFGNWLSTRLIRVLYGYRYSDLGPFRAVSPAALAQMQMADRNFGWTVEMQIRAAKLKLRTREFPVSYRRRIGVSKVSGTLKGTIMAGTIILKTIFRELFRGYAAGR